MTYKEHLGKALEKMPPSVWRDMLQIVYNHACHNGDVKPLSGGGGGGGNPPTPPN